MATIKITDLTAYTNPDTTDVLPIVDVGADVTKKVAVGEVVGKITGDVDVATDGTSSIASGVIVDADVNASAAIAGTKIDPDFGSQNVTTTGTVTGASLNPTSSTVPTNGVYLPAANSVGISTNGTGRLFIDANGNVGVGTTSPDTLLTMAGGSVLGFERSTGNSCAIAFAGDNDTDFSIECRAITLSGNAVQKIAFINESSSTRKGIAFFTTNANDFSAGTERMRITSDGELLVGTSSDSGGALLQVDGDRVRISTAKTPASASDTGTTGEICWDASYIYVCTATNTWKRAALSTW